MTTRDKIHSAQETVNKAQSALDAAEKGLESADKAFEAVDKVKAKSGKMWLLLLVLTVIGLIILARKRQSD